MSRYLTKSKFTLSLDCPTKLYYSQHREFKSTLVDDEFLEALAKGGMQVGELAKLYYPGGHDIKTLDIDEAVRQTDELLERENVIIYEAAIRSGGCLIRVDVLEKRARDLNLIEVKAKSWEPEERFLTVNGDRILSGWRKYLFDVAFQTWVMRRAFPESRINPFLMLIDKSRTCTVDGLHQHFKVVEENGRHVVEVKEGVGPADLGEQILRAVPVAEVVEMVLDGLARDPMHEPEAAGFDRWVETLVGLLENDRKYPAEVGEKCKKCEYRIGREKLDPDQLSGFETCWREAFGWRDEDFEKPLVFDIWYLGKPQDLLDQGIRKMEEMIPDSLPADPDGIYDCEECNRQQRQTVQILKQTGAHPPGEMVLRGLFRQMDSWTWPLHFIDFEAVMPAIPFHRGRSPYELIPFQFSCHTVFEDGRVEHRADWIEERPGVFPNFEFVRRLKACLEGDDGTVFRYHFFENTVLGKVREQLLRDGAPDAQELVDWIGTLITGGEREMVDQYELIKNHYYSPHMGGSNSIKVVLPAVLSESDRLKEIYSRPYSGLCINEKVFYREDRAGGRPVSPYKLLGPVGHGLPDYETGEEILENLDNGSGVIKDGGSAMMAWSRLQFGDLPEGERQTLLQSLYEYCELDTLAMVMIHQHFEELRDR